MIPGLQHGVPSLFLPYSTTLFCFLVFASYTIPIDLFSFSDLGGREEDDEYHFLSWSCSTWTIFGVYSCILESVIGR